MAVHTAAMFLVMAAIALVVYEKVGLKILRSAWINIDRIWAVALILTGVVTVCSDPVQDGAGSSRTLPFGPAPVARAAINAVPLERAWPGSPEEHLEPRRRACRSARLAARASSTAG